MLFWFLLLFLNAGLFAISDMADAEVVSVVGFTISTAAINLILIPEFVKHQDFRTMCRKYGIETTWAEWDALRKENTYTATQTWYKVLYPSGTRMNYYGDLDDKVDRISLAITTVVIVISPTLFKVPMLTSICLAGFAFAVTDRVLTHFLLTEVKE